MSKFKEHFQRDDEWLRKSVEVGVGDLQINEEVVGIDLQIKEVNLMMLDKLKEAKGPKRNKQVNFWQSTNTRKSTSACFISKNKYQSKNDCQKIFRSANLQLGYYSTYLLYDLSILLCN